MKRIELLKLFDYLQNLKVEPSNDVREFSYMVFRNKQILPSIVNGFREQAPKQSAKLEEFYVQKNKLIEKYAKRDENGNPVSQTIDGKTFVTLTDPAKFNEENAVLVSTYKIDIDQFDIDMKNFDEFMNKEYTEEIKLYKLGKDDFPKNATIEMFENLALILKE